jgi:hypothetical protein
MLVNYKPPFLIKNKDPERLIPATVKSTSDTVSEMIGTTLLGASTATTVPVVSGALQTHITCFNCNAKRHYSPDCPVETGVQHLQEQVQVNNYLSFHITPTDTHEYKFTFTQRRNNMQPSEISKTWILLDIQSTVFAFNNDK